jgi:tetratricopeptide (TPR) repeat protein
MAAELLLQPSYSPVPGTAAPAQPRRLPPVPWRDPHTVPPELLARHIQDLERACDLDPRSSDLRTCLGMAYAMNYQVYKSIDALEAAVRMEPNHFFAQLKYAEIHYRLRALIKAETETLRALELADTPWELSLARTQLQQIRTLIRAGTQKPEWTKSLFAPAIFLAVMSILLCAMVYWK